MKRSTQKVRIVCAVVAAASLLGCASQKRYDQAESQFQAALARSTGPSRVDAR